MKLFGLAFWEELRQGFIRTTRQYPVAVLCGLICAVSFSLAIDDSLRYNSIWRVRWIRLGITGGFGISLFILAELLVGRLKAKLSWAFVPVNVLGLLCLIGLYLWIPFYNGAELLNTFLIRLLMLAVLVHLAIAVIPAFIQEEPDVALWEYNKTIFTRFLLSGFFSAVFFGGVVLALISIDKMFGLDLDEENIGRIWFFCAFVLNTFLFLGAFPDMEERMNLQLDYPKWIHFFSKFILLPLVVIYFAILFVYSLKILFSWSWPNRWVGLPVFVLSAVGGLTGLLIWPLAKVEPLTPWAKTFWRFFFPLLIPLSVLLLLALQRRISDYGFTEIRYLGVILAFWILGICIYYTVRPGASFKAIPWSLICIAIVFSINPLSPASVARKSQWKRLSNILATENLLKDGILVSNPHEVDNATLDDFRSIVRYLRGNYGPELFSSMLAGVEPEIAFEGMESDWMAMPGYTFSDGFVGYTGLSSAVDADNQYINILLEKDAGVLVSGDFRVFSFQGYKGGAPWGTFPYGTKSVQILSSHDGAGLLFRLSDGKEVGSLDFENWIETKKSGLLQSAENQNSFAADDLTFSVNLENLGAITVVAQRMNIYLGKDTTSLNSGDFWVLVPQG